MDHNDQDTISLLEYGAILWRWKYFVLYIMIILIIFVAYQTISLPKMYPAETQIIAAGSESGGLGSALTANLPFAGMFQSSQTAADKIMIILKSRSLADAVIKHFDLMKVFNEKIWDYNRNTWKQGEKPPFMIDTVDTLTGITKISKTKDGAISIIVTWTDPKLSAEIANYYVYALTELLKDKSIITTIQIVDRAVPAERPKDNRLGIKLAIAGCVGFVCGIIVVFIIDFVVYQLRKSSELKAP